MLGQNVNSYWDKEALSSKQWKDDQFVRTGNVKPYVYTIVDGFTQRERVVSRGAKKLKNESLENRRVDAARHETAEDSVSQNVGEERNGSREETGENNKVEDDVEEEGGIRFAELLSLEIGRASCRERVSSPV